MGAAEAFLSGAVQRIMSVRNKHRRCAHCGETKKATVDHIPPKLLLEKPFPTNLLTVPACGDCNQSFKADDEYTRTVLATDIRATWNYAAQINLPAILRSLQRQDARGFVDYLGCQTAPAGIVTPSGAPIMVVKVDQARINASGKHILSGLYFWETGKCLPSSAVIHLGSRTGLTSEHPDLLVITRVIRQLPDHRHGSVGTAFSYFAAIGPQVSAWVMLLYDYFFWVATVDERPVSEP